MPRFSFIAKDKNGRSVENFVDASDRITASDLLQRQGYFVISITEFSLQAGQKRGAPLHRVTVKHKHKVIKLQDLIVFARQLATMLEAGVSLMRSLEVISGQVESERLSKIVAKIKEDVEKGLSLSQALAKHPKAFNQFWVSLVEVGEASGSLPTVLNKLTFYMDQQNGFRTTIVSSLIYPILLFCVACGAIAFFALFVGPRFESIFKSMNIKLPMITIILLSIFAFVRNYFMFIVAGIGVAGYLFLQFIKTPHGKEGFEHFLFKVPSVGQVFRLIVVERFSGQMAILIEAGVPILAALDIAEKLVDNITCSKIVRSIKEGVKKGELIVTPMEKSGFFPAMCVQLISVGEETGELSKMLKHVSKYYQELVEVYIKRVSTMIEPVMIVFMGAVIGTIVVAMFLPLFKMSTGG
ncbi:MAG: type II secretion system F family protein [Candidatus Omnitrophica bacterium]|nr:type II secretion system F family protein [Candidatus Omnitrophota bacterium]